MLILITIYINKQLAIPTTFNYTNDTNRANTNYTIYANKLLAIPTTLTMPMMSTIPILGTLAKKEKKENEKKN